ncbi:MAG: DUF1254 domain-containing protein [Pseudomonadota bacterium]
MMRLIVPALIFVIVAIAAHFATLHAVPGGIMGATMERMETTGLVHHEFTLAPRATPQTQSVVRPSPDLAYSVCLFDLPSDGALRVEAGPYNNYASISFFDDRTNNFATIRVGAGGAPGSGSDVVLLAPGKTAVDLDGFSGPQVEAPSRRGLILIRRLAPTQADYDRVVATSSADRCALLSG